MYLDFLSRKFLADPPPARNRRCVLGVRDRLVNNTMFFSISLFSKVCLEFDVEPELCWQTFVKLRSRSAVQISCLALSLEFWLEGLTPRNTKGFNPRQKTGRTWCTTQHDRRNANLFWLIDDFFFKIVSAEGGRCLT